MPVDTAMGTSDLMTRLHALDAALAACQRQAIAVDEPCKVRAAHSAGLEGLGSSDGEWVDALLERMAIRHGIHGLVALRTAETNAAD